MNRNKKGIAITGLAAACLIAFVLRKKEFAFATKGDAGLFDDGTVRIRVEDFERIRQSAKSSILTVESVGDFWVKSIPRR